MREFTNSLAARADFLLAFFILLAAVAAAVPPAAAVQVPSFVPMEPVR